MSRIGFVFWWLFSLFLIIWHPLWVAMAGALLLLGMPVYARLVRDQHIEIKPHTDVYELSSLYRITLLTLLKGAMYAGKVAKPNDTKLMERL